MRAVQQVAVVGGGLMGAGIAAVFAAAQYPVRIFEPLAATRESLAGRIADALKLLGAEPASADVTVTDQLASAVVNADFVTEAVSERLEVKRALFSELSALSHEHVVLASNTSVIPIGQIASGLPAAERIVGTHWWNPPHLVPLVEVVQSEFSSPAAIALTMELLRKLGKKPAHVRKDIPGFVANRLQHAMWREAIAMVAAGVCDARTLDDCVKNSFGLRLSVLGPLENADLVGLDLTLDIHRTIIPELDRSEGPHELLRAHVDAGELGCKSGQGFRSWTADEVARLRMALTKQLQRARDQRGEESAEP
jgi:3-hydroxybutyryl-CoA dehydrogenase